jgi:hypothetical protein
VIESGHEGYDTEIVSGCLVNGGLVDHAGDLSGDRSGDDGQCSADQPGDT